MGGKGFIVLPSLQLLLPLLCPNRPHSNFAAAAKQATINPPRPRDWRVCIQMRARDLRGSPQPANDPARRKRPPPSSSLLQVPRERRARPEVAAALIGRCRRRRRRCACNSWPARCGAEPLSSEAATSASAARSSPATPTGFSERAD